MRLTFHPSTDRTVGVEWELGLVDPIDGDLSNRADEVFAALEPSTTPGRARVTRELLRNTVELVTGICRDVGEAVDDLAGCLAEVRTVTDGLGLSLFGAGSHPFARWEAAEVSDGDRYATLIDRTRWWGRQMLIFGVHVHVGMPSAQAALAVLNGMLPYAPHLQALSASSPYWAGLDTGYASNRALMFQQLPTAGLPFQFDTWAQYESYLDDVFTTGVIDDVSELRWDLRPVARLGTLETRVCDGVPTLVEVGALAALTHCLVADLTDRHLAGETLPTLPPWHVQENKWRAARYGTDAIVVLDAAGREELVTDDLRSLLDRLAPTAARLGCTRELAGVERILAAGAGYTRQRRVAEATGGDLKAVVAAVVEELEENDLKA